MHLNKYAVRADILLMPIIAGAHWTLLVVQRQEARAALNAPADAVAPRQAASAAEGFGCRICKRDRGCQNCNHVLEKKWLARLDRENELLHPCEELQPLPESSGWDIRYYDSLQVPSEECSKAAEVLLYGLQNANVLNAPTAEELRNTRINKHLEDNKTACGYHVLHFIETEMRRSLGEGEWPCRFDVGRRVRLLQGIWRKFRRPKPATNVHRNQLMLENA